MGSEETTYRDMGTIKEPRRKDETCRDEQEQEVAITHRFERIWGNDNVTNGTMEDGLPDGCDNY